MPNRRGTYFVFLEFFLCSVTVNCAKSVLYGLRIEDTTLVGFDAKGSSRIPVGTTYIRLFGNAISDVSEVIFTQSSTVCPSRDGVSAPFSLGPFEVDESKPTKADSFVVAASFPSVGHTYYVCLGSPDTDRKNFTYTLGSSSAFSAVIVTTPERHYYLPMPVQICTIVILLCLSGLFSGLNLGLMALDQTELKIIQNSGTKKERQFAEKIIPVRKTGNYLLCTLLFGNVIVNSGISILFDDLTSGFIALVVSSLAIVILGEITPQSVCSRYGLAVGARTIWLTKFFMVLTFPLSFPISKVLDKILGEEVGTVYNRERLLELIRLSQEAQGELKNCQEVAIVSGALLFSKKTVKHVMTDVRDVYMVPHDATLDTKLVSEIVQSGFTRIPVYGESRNDVVGLLNVKDLALLDPDDCITVKTVCGFYQHPIRFVLEDMPLNTMLEEFKVGHYHMAFVRRISEPLEGDPYYEMVGLVTLEDIIEEIIQSEIMDETDVITDNRRRLRRREVQLRDFSSLMQDTSAQISPQLAVAAFQYLSTAFDPFKSTYIAEPVLQKLIKQNVVQATPSDADEAPKILYEKGKPADHFVLVLEGHMEVLMGEESMIFEAGPFFAFGKQVMEKMVQSARRLSVVPTQNISAEGYKHAASFIPDFSVRITDKVVYLLIRAKTYHDAYRSTLIRQGYDKNPLKNLGSPMTSEPTSPDRSQRSCYQDSADSLKGPLLRGDGSRHGRHCRSASTGDAADEKIRRYSTPFEEARVREALRKRARNSVDVLGKFQTTSFHDPAKPLIPVQLSSSSDILVPCSPSSLHKQAFVTEAATTPERLTSCPEDAILTPSPRSGSLTSVFEDGRVKALECEPFIANGNANLPLIDDSPGCAFHNSTDKRPASFSKVPSAKDVA